MVAMSRNVDPSTPPSRWTSSAAWKMCAVAPIAILCTLLLVKAVGSLAGSGAAPEAADVAVAGVGRTPPVTSADPTEEARKRLRADKTSQAAEADPTTADPTRADPTTADPMTADPMTAGSSSPESTPTPSQGDTTTPSPSSPSPTPTPEEARDECERSGVSPFDLRAMAACVAEAMGD